MTKPINFLILLMIAFGMIACDNTQTGADTANAMTDSVSLENTIPADDVKASNLSLNDINGKYIIDQGSIVSWTGTSAIKNHVGTLNIKSGEFNLENGVIKSGSFVMDMSSLVNTDLTSDKGKEKLEKHLKSEDFFDVEKYPEATFTVKNSQIVTGNDKVTHKINGDLKVKDISQPLTLEAYVIASDEGKVITATTGNFEIDRTKYGIKYNSGVINTAKDKIIHDELGLVINIRAKKS